MGSKRCTEEFKIEAVSMSSNVVILFKMHAESVLKAQLMAVWRRKIKYEVLVNSG